jgi:hypothetical protein
MSNWIFKGWALALAALIMSGAAPARAQSSDYCAETFDRTLGLGRTADDPVGDCRLLEEFRIRHSDGVTSVRLMHDSGANSRERAMAMRPQLITTIEAVEARMRSLGAVTLPPTVSIIAVSHRHPAAANARTSSQFFRRLSASNDCPIVIYPSREISAAAQRRILAHELFHCVQFDTWPEQTRDEDGTSWWREGSAEWFEDFALPGDWEDSSLPQSVGLFEENCETKALHEQRYANIVLFGWLHQQGLPRLVTFIGALARGGEAAEDGLRRAMTAAEYNRFAQDYVEDRIILPSGWRVVGSRRPLTPAGTTTGEPDADPDIERPVRKAFTIVRQKVEFAPGEYAPDGELGDEKSVFSEAPGRWSALPERLVVACGERKEFRIVGMPVEASPAAVKIKPRTDKAVQCGECGATGGAVRRAGCVVGSWRQVRGPDCSWIATLGASMRGVTVTPLACEPGEAEATFNRDGSFEGVLRNALRRVQIEMPSRRGRPTQMTMENEITLAKGACLWRADDASGSLRLCSTTTTGDGVMRMSGVEEASGAPIEIERPMAFRPVAQLDLAYSCAGDRMTITVPAPGGAAAPITIEPARSAARR